MQRLLSIAGFPKSATTLLLALLDGHSECVVFPEELKWFTKVRHLSSRADKIVSILSETGAYVPSLGIVRWSSGTRDYSAIPGNDYLADLLKALLRSGDDKELLRAIFTTWAKYTSQNYASAKWFVEKTPGNELQINLIKKDYDDFKMIYCMRDPRDNYYSYKVKQPGLSVHEFCSRWNSSVSSIIDKPEVKIIQYERLMCDQINEMTAVCSFLDIKFEQSILVPTRGGKSWSGNSMFKQNDSTKIQTFALARRWLNMDDRERKIIEAKCKKYMKRFDYDS